MTLRSESYSPPLRVRELPFDLRKAIVLEDPASLARDFGPTVFLEFLSLNMIAEFAETLLYYLNRTHGMMADQAESRTFVHQELRHAGALHVVNRWLVKDDYVLTEFGRLSGLCQAVRAPLLLELRAAAQDDSRRPELLRRLSLEIAAFETTFGLLAQVPQFDLLADSPEQFLKHPVFSYVTFYHAAEEAEHIHVSWQHHQRTYGQDIFEVDHIPSLIAVMERLFDEITRMTFLVAQRVGQTITLEAVEASPPAQARRRMLEQLAGGRFHPEYYTELRRSCVESWDGFWEPQFRQAVEERLSRAPAANTI